MNDVAEKITPIEGDFIKALPEETKANLAIISETEKLLIRVEVEYAEVPDVDTKDGMALAKERRSEMKIARTGGDKVRLAATKPARDWIDQVNEQWNNGFAPRLLKIEKLYDDAIKSAEEIAKKEKRERLEKERLRIEKIQSAIDIIKLAPVRAITVEDIDAEVEHLKTIDLDQFEEHKDAAAVHINAAINALDERRKQMVEQAAETERLAKQKKEQDEREAKLKKQEDDLAENQRKADADKQAQEEKETARIAGINNQIQAVESAPERLTTIEAIDEFQEQLKAPFDYQEFTSTANHAIANTTLILTTKRDQLVKDKAKSDANAEKKRKDDLEAERLKGVAEEQARIKSEEEAEAVTKAEAKRLQALAPDAEKIRSYILDLLEVARPDVESDEAEAVLDGMRIQLEQLTELIEPLDGAKAA